MARSDADKYGLGERMTDRLLDTIGCESNWDTHAISKTGDYGIAQLHVKSWGFTKEQSFDPTFSLDFMAKEFSKGEAHYWVCYKRLFM